MRKETYSIDEVEAALCVWEWLLEQREKEGQQGGSFDILFDGYGSGGMRSSAIQAGIIVAETYTEYEKHLEFDECFDWAFVPLVCRALDWTFLVNNNQYGSGVWSPDIPALVATLIATRALAA